jgi:protein SCO1/2
MRSIAHWIAVLVAVATLATAAGAHSLEELQDKLFKDEKYYQKLDKPAPNFTLGDADRKVYRLADFRGKVVVLHFIYASCPDVCPLHADRIAEIQKMINQTPMKERVQFISISTDPEHDTPEILRGYGPAHGLDDSNWIFLTALPDQPKDVTRKLVEAYGHGFTRTDSGQLMHGVVTHVIDKEGRLRGNFHGLDFADVNLVMLVNALTNDIQRPHHQPERNLWDKLRALF